MLVLRDPTLVAEDPISALYGRLFRVKSHDRIVPIADAWAFENRVNPDAQVGNPIVDSNPVDVLVDHGRFVMADAGGNSVIRTDHRGRLEALSIFPNIPKPHPFIPGAIVPMQAVPTGVVEGPDGFYYVSQLTGFPFPAGEANVFRVNPRTGAYTVYATGFTMAMDLDFGDDGTLYVLELDSDNILGGQHRRQHLDGVQARCQAQARPARGHVDRAGRNRRGAPRQAVRVQPRAQRGNRRSAADRPGLRGRSTGGKGSGPKTAPSCRCEGVDLRPFWDPCSSPDPHRWTPSAPSPGSGAPAVAPR